MHLDRCLLRAAALLPVLALGPAFAQQSPGPPPATAATPCTGDVCTITVSIREHCRAPQGIVITPAVVSTRQPAILRWKLENGSYEFHADGIVFDQIDQFERMNSPNDLREERIRDSKTKTGDFRYVVRLRGCPEVPAYIRHE
jgi:hypothetical protein